MLGVVIVLLGFDPRIGQVINRHVEAKTPARDVYQLRQFEDGELLRELVEDAELSSGRGIEASQLNTTNGVSDVEEAASLAAFAVDRDGMFDGGLHAEAVEGSAKDLVVVEAVDEGFVNGSFIGDGAVDHSLIQIGGADAPDLAAEMDIVAIVNLGEMVKRARLLGEGQQILTAIMLDANEALFNVDVGCAVFTHGPKFDQVAVWLEFLDREQNVDSSDDIVDLAENGVLAIDHGVGRGPLLGKMNDGLGRKFFHGGGQEFVVEDVANETLDLLPGVALPGAQALGQRTNGRQRLRAQFVIPGTTMKVVGDCNIMAAVGKV